jgi:hypothetical protein
MFLFFSFYAIVRFLKKGITEVELLSWALKEGDTIEEVHN